MEDNILLYSYSLGWAVELRSSTSLQQQPYIYTRIRAANYTGSVVKNKIISTAYINPYVYILCVRAVFNVQVFDAPRSYCRVECIVLFETTFFDVIAYSTMPQGCHFQLFVYERGGVECRRFTWPIITDSM